MPTRPWLKRRDEPKRAAGPRGAVCCVGSVGSCRHFKPRCPEGFRNDMWRVHCRRLKRRERARLQATALGLAVASGAVRQVRST